MQLANAWSFFRRLGLNIQQSDDAGKAAEMAYHLMLSLFPMLIVIIGILKYIGMQYDLFDDVMPMLFAALPKDMVPVMRDTVIDIVKAPTHTFALVAFAGFIWTASNGALALIKGICQTYQFDYLGNSTVKDRLLSIVLILWVNLVLVLALNVLFFGNTLISWFADHLYLSEFITMALQVFKVVLGLGGLVVSSIFIYTLALKQVTPHIHWKQTLPGAFTFVLLWLLMTFGFKLYVEQFGNFNKVYGALGGVIILMTWLYLSSFIVLVGAEINAMWHMHRLKQKSEVPENSSHPALITPA
jgi:membrane protein